MRHLSLLLLGFLGQFVDFPFYPIGASLIFKCALEIVAYSFLHLDCLAASLKQSPLPTKTIGQACRDQTQKLLEALILFAYDKLQQGQTAAAVLATLFAKQRLTVT